MSKAEGSKRKAQLLGARGMGVHLPPMCGRARARAMRAVRPAGTSTGARPEHRWIRPASQNAAGAKAGATRVAGHASGASPGPHDVARMSLAHNANTKHGRLGSIPDSPTSDITWTPVRTAAKMPEPIAMKGARPV